MPRGSNAFSNLDTGDAIANSNNFSDSLVSGHAGKKITQQPLLYEEVGVADTAGKYFHEHVTWARLLELNILENQVFAFALEEGGFVGLWQRWRHY
jgi:hypothetical protein